MARSIVRKTEIPGPRSRELMQLKERYVANGKSVFAPIFVDRAEGALLTDVDGNTYIDLAGGFGVMNVGYSQPAVIEAIRRQVERFTHTDFSVVPYESYVRLAQRLSELAPMSGQKKAVFFNSGAEAVENAIKIAKHHTGRRAVIAFEGAFHGRTWMALTLTHKAKPYKAGLGPFVPEVYRAPYPYPYRGPEGMTPEEVGEWALAQLRRMLEVTVAPEDVAAIIIEPVLGEGGFVVPPRNFMVGLRELCTEHGIVLIHDEVQTGFGRTGHLFASEYFGTEPDLITVAKSIAGGMVLSGVIGKAEVVDSAHDSAIGGTYVGNPVSCAAALAVLDVFEQQNLVERAREVGDRFRRRFERMQERFPQIGEVRGLGAMVAMELVRDRSTKEPATEETAQVLQQCLRRGVISARAGIYGNVIRVLVPLVITDEQIDEACDVLEESLAAVFGG
ncbi:MAG: 4-aminobutyrate--2-oxoglutarate transaminase [Bacillota bacterium]|nr:MAG: 4-aminobutyrate--2-oxoglutarate transaminase [Bacillota bacterium]